MMVATMQHVLLRVLLMCCVVNAVINTEEVQEQLRHRLVPVNMPLLARKCIGTARKCIGTLE